MRNLLMILILVSNSSFSQSSFEVTDYENPAPANFELYDYNLALDTFENNIGPNKAKFGYTYLGFGGPLGPVEGDYKSAIIPSTNFQLGMIGKLKINNILAIAGYIQYDRSAFLMAQNDDKAFPDSTQYDKQKFAFHSLQTAPFIRINFDPILGRKRGNYLGDYIDFGPYIGYSFAVRQVTKFVDESSGEKLRVVKRNMDYLDRLNYGWSARLGFNHFAFYGTYRLSNWVDQEKYKFTFPRYSLGIHFCFFSS